MEEAKKMEEEAVNEKREITVEETTAEIEKIIRKTVTEKHRKKMESTLTSLNTGATNKKKKYI